MAGRLTLYLILTFVIAATVTVGVCLRRHERWSQELQWRADHEARLEAEHYRHPRRDEAPASRGVTYNQIDPETGRRKRR